MTKMCTLLNGVKNAEQNKVWLDVVKELDLSFWKSYGTFLRCWDWALQSKINVYVYCIQALRPYSSAIVHKNQIDENFLENQVEFNSE